MTNTMIREKIMNLETEIMFLKRAVVNKPNFDVDEKNWMKIRPAMKKIREKVYRETYA